MMPGTAALSGAGTLGGTNLFTDPPGIAWRTVPAVTTTTTTPTTWPVTKQVGTVATDWVLIWVYGGGAAVACTGFTTVADASNFSCLLYRYCDGTEGATFTLTGLYGTRPLSVIIATISGAAAALDPAVVAAPAGRHHRNVHPGEQHHAG